MTQKNAVNLIVALRNVIGSLQDAESRLLCEVISKALYLSNTSKQTVMDMLGELPYLYDSSERLAWCKSIFDYVTEHQTRELKVQNNHHTGSLDGFMRSENSITVFECKSVLTLHDKARHRIYALDPLITCNEAMTVNIFSDCHQQIEPKRAQCNDEYLVWSKDAWLYASGCWETRSKLSLVIHDCAHAGSGEQVPRCNAPTKEGQKTSELETLILCAELVNYEASRDTNQGDSHGVFVMKMPATRSPRETAI